MTNDPPKTLRGIRDSIPQGSVLGRTSQGIGPPEVIPLSALAKRLLATNLIQPSSPSTPGVSYLGFFFRGPLPANATLYGALSHRTLTFPSATIASFAEAETAATASFTLPLYFEGVGQVATISWSAAGTVGTITWSGTYSLASLKLPYVIVPNIFDLTLANISLLLAGDITA